jgi:glycerol-3-phosphate cytidylyltransferase
MKSDRIVFASGVFDLFHIGHLQFLEQARALGDRLIVGVQTDEWVAESKGEAPIYPLQHRLRLVAALACVDVAFPIQGPEDEIGVVLCGATIRAVGTDHGYLPLHQPLQQKLEAAGVKYIVIPRTPNISTTKIKEKCCEQQEGNPDSNSGGSIPRRYVWRCDIPPDSSA